MTNYLIANHHIRQTQLTQYYNVKSNILKTKCMIGLTSICLMGFALFLFLYAILRTRIMLDTKGNIALCIVWNLFGVGNALAFEIMMIIFISRGHKSCQHRHDNSNRDNGNGGNEDGHHHGNVIFLMMIIIPVLKLRQMLVVRRLMKRMPIITKIWYINYNS
ncbi:hypothetical protein BJ944DRAFT_4152 [Cunninghamella echinulata]|nr:hypothetical protein BJ944DRAFT_4152 [Cunninghamella echinulata]